MLLQITNLVEKFEKYSVRLMNDMIRNDVIF